MAHQRQERAIDGENGFPGYIELEETRSQGFGIGDGGDP
jgi:hypothetical protein